MENCYIEFEPISAHSLNRTNQIFEIIKVEKESGRNPNEEYITNSLNESEKSYFTNFTEEEFKEWNQFWFSTPIEIRHSANMPTPGWDLESMYDAFWSGEYQLIAIVKLVKSINSNSVHILIHMVARGAWLLYLKVWETILLESKMVQVIGAI